MKKLVVMFFAIAMTIVLGQQVPAAPPHAPGHHASPHASGQHVSSHAIQACVEAHIKGALHGKPERMSAPTDIRYAGKHAWEVKAWFRTRHHKMAGTFIVQQRGSHGNDVRVVHEKMWRR
ncbi:MAG: hypothetical protein IJU37_09380 [Desulfovibrio sp.]|nr:hypothetical protein [Desulfovibrio sp.]